VLTFTQDGTTVPQEVPEEPVGSEYDRQLDQIAGMLTDPAARGHALREARWTIGVIEDVYRSARRRTA
jgi:oxidoreductase